MTMTQELVTLLLSGGGIGWLCSRLLEWLETYWLWFQTLRPDLKRLVTFVLVTASAMSIGAAVTLFAAWMGFGSLPASAQEWVGLMIATAGTAITASQVTHASREQTARVKAEEDARWRLIMGQGE